MSEQQKSEGMEDFMDIPSSAKVIGVSESNVYRWNRLRLIPGGTRRGKAVLRVAAVERLRKFYNEFGRLKSPELKMFPPSEWVYPEQVQQNFPFITDEYKLEIGTQASSGCSGQGLIKENLPSPEKVASAAKLLYRNGHKEVALALSMTLVEQFT